MTEQKEYAPFWTKRVLTLVEVSEYTGYKPSYLKKLACQGEIPFSRPNGRMLFFDRQKIEEWLLSNPQKSRQEIDQAARRQMSDNQSHKRKS